MQRLCAGAPNHGEPRADFSAAAPVRPRPKKNTLVKAWLSQANTSGLIWACWTATPPGCWTRGARTYEQLHRQRSFGGVCPHGILSPTQVPQIDSDGNPDRILQFWTSAEQLARRWCGVVDGRSIRKSARSRTERQLGGASGTTVSHVADLVGPEGCVYAVEFSKRSGRDLVNMAKKRTNVIPIIEDARHP